MLYIEKELREALALLDGVPVVGREHRKNMATAETKILAVVNVLGKAETEIREVVNVLEKTKGKEGREDGNAENGKGDDTQG